MAQDVKKPQKLSHLSFIARGLLIIAGAFILRAYFFRIPRKFHFTKSDELMHFTGFFVLGLMLAIAFPKYRTPLILSLIVLCGILLEFAQPLLTKSRELSLADMLANGSGGLIGYGLGAMIMYRAIRPSQ